MPPAAALAPQPSLTCSHCKDTGPATFECDGCPEFLAADALFDGGNGGFYCADCCRADEWFAGEKPDLETLEDHREAA